MKRLASALNNLGRVPAVIYGLRYKEMRRDERIVENYRRMAVTSSQFARQTPK